MSFIFRELLVFTALNVTQCSEQSGVLIAVEIVVYVMWCYFTFWTAVINIATDPTQ